MFQDVPGCSRSPFMFCLFCGIRYDFDLSSKRLLHQGGLIKSSSRAGQGLRRDGGGPFVCQNEKVVCLRRCWFLDQGTQVEWFVCV